MKRKDDHLIEMEKKSKVSIKKYEIHMLGTGMFADFDKTEKKKNQGEEHETR